VAETRGSEPRTSIPPDEMAEMDRAQEGSGEPAGEPSCPWCKTDAIEAAKRHEGPHATWCPQFREEQRGGEPSQGAREWLIRTRGYSGQETLVTKLDVLAASCEAYAQLERTALLEALKAITAEVKRLSYHSQLEHMGPFVTQAERAIRKAERP